MPIFNKDTLIYYITDYNTMGQKMAKYSYPVIKILSVENEKDSLAEQAKCVEDLDALLVSLNIPHKITKRNCEVFSHITVDVNDFINFIKMVNNNVG